MSLTNTWLFVPAHNQAMIAKAMGLDVDVAVFDLEDGVPPDHKDAARKIAAATLGARRPGPLCFVRTQSSDSDAFACDLDAVIRPGLAGVVLPKVEQAQELQRVDALLAERETRQGLKPGAVRLVAIIESARGLIAAPAIAAASSRLIALLFGAEDFALDLGMPALREGEAARMAYARSAVVVAAASQRLQAIDRVYLDVRDLDGLRADAHEGRQLGFTGKALIHPNQIEVVRKVFAPTAEQLEHARQIVAAFDQAWAKGVGSITVAGQLVDYPIAEQARRVLDAYRSQM
jgi:citrate lyase subunit beta/citryl-CoA lyase